MEILKFNGYVGQGFSPCLIFSIKKPTPICPKMSYLLRFVSKCVRILFRMQLCLQIMSVLVIKLNKNRPFIPLLPTWNNSCTFIVLILCFGLPLVWRLLGGVA